VYKNYQSIDDFQREIDTIRIEGDARRRRPVPEPEPSSAQEPLIG
jgi:hypothetical protein